MDPAIIPRDRLDSFIQDVYHNFGELHAHHRRLLERFHEIQREEHPLIRSVTAAMYDAVLNFRDAYLDYIPNYPIAAYRIDDEMNNNPQFKAFVDVRLFVANLTCCFDFCANLAMHSTSRCTSTGHEEFHQQADSPASSV
jgi:hypothetical protein